MQQGIVNSQGNTVPARSRWWMRRRILLGAMVAVVIAALALGYAASAHLIGPRPAPTGPINQRALLHDSHNPLYRSPTGAVKTGVAIVLRLRTAVNNVAQVKLRVWDALAQGRHGTVVWYTARQVRTSGAYAFWQVTIPAQPDPHLFAYKWQLVSGSHVVWYEDHYNRALGSCDQIGGVGQVFEGLGDPDCSYELTVYKSNFTVPNWITHAVIYQIFVDRFYDGSPANDSLLQPNRYLGSCDGPDGGPTATGYYVHTSWNDEPLQPPQNCDFYGGDLQGIIARLDYLHGLGVNALYLNPIFLADSNHKYDTADYTLIDPHFGNLRVWQQLVEKARSLGMHIILDGVFNHTSSDSIYFDRYNVWRTNGAYQSQSSPYADWYQFTGWPSYNGWFGVDALPQLTEQQGVRNFLFAGDANFVRDANDAAIRARYGEQPLTVSSGANSVAKYWLAQGASGWRLDAPESKSDDWWQAFRTAIKSYDPDAVLIGEHWGDASQWLLGDQDDGTMNYRFRSAVLSFFADGGIDTAPGHDPQFSFTASQFMAHLQSVLDEYPRPAVYASMNLLDSHDVGRILWELGGGAGATPSQVALAKQKLRLIVLLQMTWIGAPTIYYGDEAGQTQSDLKVDPADRRTFPWGHQDTALEDWYRTWIGIRMANPVLQTGDETTLLADDAARVVAYQRRDAGHMAVVVLNADAPGKTHSVTVTVPGVPDGTRFTDAATHAQITSVHGQVTLSVDGMSGRVLLA
ncbi:MAG TPA: glycoside hydrolase family 13 protein [Ktedonobacterales bacterium]|nr:glycoside hydrolase family 13 protein [Ktedonobacterales bacterium]